VPTGAGKAQVLAGDFITALAWSPDGRLFYTERDGRVMVLQGSTPIQVADYRSAVSTSGERGQLGLALSPDFAHNHTLYVFQSRSDDITTQRVVRVKECAGHDAGDGVLIDNLPASPPGNAADCCHKGGRLAFGPDGKLYVTLGENHDAPAAQDTSSLRGKVLRYNEDGGVPADNPFGATNPVWAYGLRNPFGIAFSPDGTTLITNNGPSGDAGSPGTGYDVVQVVTKGAHFQWPNCYGYSHPIGSQSCAGMTEPVWSTEAGTIVPTGVGYIDARGPGAYAGHFVFCSYRDGQARIYRGPRDVVPADGGCNMDVKQGPDHAVYFSASNSVIRLG
jgi:glucose/arabinose dehydrogenase